MGACTSTVCCTMFGEEYPPGVFLKKGLSRLNKQLRQMRPWGSKCYPTSVMPAFLPRESGQVVQWGCYALHVVQLMTITGMLVVHSLANRHGPILVP